MSDAIGTGTIVTMDRQGRLVIPKVIRDEAGIAPGVPLEVRVKDGRIELQPTYLRVRVVEKDGFAACEPLEPVEPLTRDEVRQAIRDLREGRRR